MTRRWGGAGWIVAALGAAACGADTAGTGDETSSSTGVVDAGSSAASGPASSAAVGVGSTGTGESSSTGSGGAGGGTGGSEGTGGDGAGAASAGGPGGGGDGGAGTGGAGGAEPLDPPAILSAFWGVDNAPGVPPLDCDGLNGLRDGMPIVLSAEVDQATLDATDIEIELASGALRAPACVKLLPADEENEDRTILLVGDLGSANDPPVEVRVVASLLLEDGQDAIGASTNDIVGTDAGPSLVVAERVSEGEREVGAPDDCPEETVAIVRTIWNGGVDGDMGAELDAAQLDSFFVEVDAGAGTTELVNPFAFGDLNDGDNNVDLCLDDARAPLRVRVLADTVTDPTNDWNAETEVVVTPD